MQQHHHLLQQSVMMRKSGEDTLGGETSSDIANGTASSENKVLDANKSVKTSLRFHNNNSVLFYAVASVLFLFAFSFDMHVVAGSLRCPPCPGGMCPEPIDCRHGVTTDFCGRRICAKGPGQICGTGLFKMLGSCGDGMYCHCGKCTGCSLITYECFDETCPGNGNSNSFFNGRK